MTGTPPRYQPPCPCSYYEPDYACIVSRHCLRPAQWDAWTALPDESARRRFSPDQMPVYDYDKQDLDQRAKESAYDVYQSNAGKICSWDKCRKKAKVKGMCRYHYGIYHKRKKAGAKGKRLYAPVRSYRRAE